MKVLALLTLAASLAATGCGSTPLITAVRQRDLAEVQRLVESGADINARSSLGPISTPLGHAARVDSPEIVAYLIKKGASHQPEVLQYAAFEKKMRIVEVMAGGAPGSAPPIPSAMTLCKTLIKGDLEGAKALLDRGVDPNARVDNGYTLFNCAIQSKRADLVRLLIERGTRRASAFESPGWGRPTDHQFAQNMRLPEIAAMFTEEPRRSPGNLDDAAYDRMRAAAGMPPEKREPVSDVDQPKRRGAERPDDFALVIGIEDYQSLPKADYGVRDAKTMRKHLEALGFPPRNIISLEGPQATGNKLKSYLEEWLPLNVKPESTLFVYYSGHGAPDPKTGDAYLVPWDGDASFLKSTAYPLSKFYADLSKTKAKRVLVALDACFSGAGGRSVLAQGARPLVAKVAQTPAGGRVTVLAAASGEEITGSLNEQGHGMFTYFLLKALSEGKRTSKELHDSLSPRVQDEARRQNRQQTPALIGDDVPL